jgi:hypothetical protein
LRCTTFFGRFGLDQDGRQRNHDVLVVQRRAGTKRLVWPSGVGESGPPPYNPQIVWEIHPVTSIRAL